MHWQFTSYVLPEVISMVVSVWLVLAAWQRRSTSGATAFGLLSTLSIPYPSRDRSRCRSPVWRCAECPQKKRNNHNREANESKDQKAHQANEGQE